MLLFQSHEQSYELERASHGVARMQTLPIGFGITCW